MSLADLYQDDVFKQLMTDYAAASSAGDEAEARRVLDSIFDKLEEAGVLDQLAENGATLGEDIPELIRIARRFTETIGETAIRDNQAMQQGFLQTMKGLLDNNVGAAGGVLDFGRSLIQFGKMVGGLMGLDENSDVMQWLNNAEETIIGMREELSDEVDQYARTEYDRDEARAIGREAQSRSIEDFNLGLTEMDQIVAQLESVTIGSASGTNAAPDAAPDASGSGTEGRITAEQWASYARSIEDGPKRAVVARGFEGAAAQGGDPNVVDTPEDQRAIARVIGSADLNDADRQRGMDLIPS